MDDKILSDKMNQCFREWATTSGIFSPVSCKTIQERALAHNFSQENE